MTGLPTKTWISLCCLTLSVLSASASHAEKAKKAKIAAEDRINATGGPADAKDAREKFKKASIQFNLGNFDKAVQLYEELYEKYPNQPVLLYNLAQTHRIAGDSEKALFFYKRYLVNLPDAPNRTEVAGRIVDLERIVAEVKRSQQPPNGVAEEPATPRPGSVETPTTAVLVAPVPPPKRDKPLYKKWWLWVAVVGGAAVVGTGVALGVVLSRPSGFSSPYPPFGPAALTMPLVQGRF